ncbi:MAG: hypothetical protein N2C14_09120, partial [Planctomycetales bacterium]
MVEFDDSRRRQETQQPRERRASSLGRSGFAAGIGAGVFAACAAAGFGQYLLAAFVGAVAVCVLFMGIGYFNRRSRGASGSTNVSGSRIDSNESEEYKLAHDDSADLDSAADGGELTISPGIDTIIGDPSPREFIMLLTSDTALRSRVHQEVFADFVLAVRRTVEEFFAERASATGVDLQIACALAPERKTLVEVQSQPDLAADAHADLTARLNRLVCPAVRGGPAAFVSRMLAQGGAEQPQ